MTPPRILKVESEQQLIRQVFSPVVGANSDKARLLVVGGYNPQKDGSPEFLAGLGRNVQVGVLDVQSPIAYKELRSRARAFDDRYKRAKANSRSSDPDKSAHFLKEAEKLRRKSESAASKADRFGITMGSGEGDGLEHVRHWKRIMAERYGADWKNHPGRTEGTVHFLLGNWAKMRIAGWGHEAGKGSPVKEKDWHGLLCRGTLQFIEQTAENAGYYGYRTAENMRKDALRKMVMAVKPGMPVLLEMKTGGFQSRPFRNPSEAAVHIRSMVGDLAEVEFYRIPEPAKGDCLGHYHYPFAAVIRRR